MIYMNNKIIDGKLTHKIRRLYFKLSPKVVIGIIGIILMYVGLAGTASAMTPYWVGRGDTAAHMDYVWRIYNGSIPMWEDGVSYPKFLELRTSPVNYQPASANPPLFYIVHAPIVGYLMDGGHWKEAVAIGRVINVLMGISCILVLAWAAWQVGGRYKKQLTLTVPAFGVLNYRFAILNLDYALDALIVLLATLMFILIYKILSNGVNRQYLVLLTILSVAGMLTKATYIIFVAIGILSVLISYKLNSRKSDPFIDRKTVRSIAFVAVMTIIFSGWFYFVWNFLRTGSWFSPFPEGFTGGRDVKGVGEVLADTRLWGLFYASYSRLEVISIAISSFALAGWLSFKGSMRESLSSNKINFAYFSLLGIATAGIFATQIVHAVGIGAYNFRYMLPAIFPISLFLSFGLVQLMRLRKLVIAISVIGLSLSTFYILPKLPTFRSGVPGINKISGGTVPKIEFAISSNNLPVSISFTLFALFVIGALLYIYSLNFKLPNYSKFKDTLKTMINSIFSTREHTKR